MSPDEGQEEYEEAQAEIKKKEDEVGPEWVGFMMHVKRLTKPGERKYCSMPLTPALGTIFCLFNVAVVHVLFITHFLCNWTMHVVIQCLA